MQENPQTFNNIQKIDFDKTCRSCLSCTDLANIFEVYYEDTKMCDILEYLFNININLEDALPKGFCESCITEVVQFYIFKKKLEQSQIRLQMIMTKSEPVEQVVEVESNTVDEVEAEKNPSVLFSRDEDCDVENDLENKPFSFSDSEDEILRETYGIPKDLVIEFSDVDVAKQELVKEGFILNQTNFNGEAEILKYTCEQTLCINNQEIEEEKTVQGENTNLKQIVLEKGKDKKKKDKELEIEKQFKCKICTKVVSWKKKATHMNIHNKDKYRECPICSRLFSTQFNLSRHLRVHSGQKPFICEFCGKAFARQDFLNTHILSHTGKKPFVCEYCGKGFCQKQALRAHQMLHSNARHYKCEFCSKQFLREKSLLFHKRKHTGFKCTNCDNTYESKTLLNNHLKTHGIEIKETENEYVCTICDKEFVSKGILKTHMIFHGEKHFSCTFCDKKFVLKHLLEIHLRVHTGDKPFVCKVCDKRFAQLSSLSRHSYQHSGKTPYVCKICGKGFKQTHHLKYHMMCHSGKQPFACPYCPKRSRSSYYMESHVRLHTGERPFKCDVCSKAFTDNITMKKHRKRMHKT